MRRHVIFTLGRSGSNYLVNTLNLHPHVTNYGEVLGDWTLPWKLYRRLRLGGSSVLEYLEYLYSSRAFFYMAQSYSTWSHFRKRRSLRFKRWGRVESIGIKDFSLNFKRRGALDFLKQRSDISVINLYRENALKRLVSVTAMEATGVVSLTNGAQAPSEKLRLPPERLVENLVTYEGETNEQLSFCRCLEADRVLDIRYEDYFASAESKDHHNRLVFTFLGVEPLRVRSSHQKILSRPLADIIGNYSEVCRVLRGTEYEKYLG